MDERFPLRLTASAVVKEKRLAALAAERPAAASRAAAEVEAAEVQGSLALAGVAATLDEVRSAQRGASPSHEGAARLVRARRAVEASEPFSTRAVQAWHAAATGSSGLRHQERSGGSGPAGAPPAFIASRLAILEQWVEQQSARELRPAQQGALVLARLVEIAPFDDGNGRVARLAASHVMVRAGGRPPILVAEDGPRLAKALEAAFALQTDGLVALLEEAQGRALDVMIAALESAPLSPPPR